MKILKKWWFWLIIIVVVVVLVVIYLPSWNCHCGIDGCNVIPEHCHNMFEAWGHVH